MLIRPFRISDEAAVVTLWKQCELTRPWNDPHKDIARKLAVQPELFLVGVIDEAVMASVMAGYEGHRGWVNYLAVAPRFRGRGHARALMQQVEALLLERGCPKVSLLVRTSNREALEFYRHLGYAQDEAISLGKRLIVDTPPD
jgi:ribosomal protein S18 acetylase RimI-like enzyme